MKQPKKEEHIEKENNIIKGPWPEKEEEDVTPPRVPLPLRPLHWAAQQIKRTCRAIIEFLW
jgi:hypothetical protein